MVGCLTIHLEKWLAIGKTCCILSVDEVNSAINNDAQSLGLWIKIKDVLIERGVEI